METGIRGKSEIAAFKSMMKKKIIVAVITDLVTDQRVHKVCTYLHQKGADVTVIGRKLRNSQNIPERPYRSKRIACYFTKGIAQYAEFNFKLFFKLLFSRGDIFLSNDLDTLVPGYFTTLLKGKILVYDSHEYFTGTPELQHKPLKRKVWKSLENWILPKLKFSYTVNESIAELYRKETGIEMKVVRNIPMRSIHQIGEAPMLPHNRRLLIMQGTGINPDRGYEEAILAMELLSHEYLLVIIGSGTIWKQLEALVREKVLADRVMLIGKVPPETLRAYTKQAHLGLSFDKPDCLNYKFSLPNKVFDYIYAGVPVLSSDLPEIKKILTRYDVGTCIPEVTPSAIARNIQAVFADEAGLNRMRENTIHARESLSWEKETEVLDQIYLPLLK